LTPTRGHSTGLRATSFYPVTLRVTDGDLSASWELAILVSNTNRAPVLDPIGDKNVKKGQPLSFTVSASDPDGEEVSLSAVGVPSGAEFDTLSGLFIWTPRKGDSGTYEVLFRASDGDNLTDEEMISIVVTEDDPCGCGCNHSAGGENTTFLVLAACAFLFLHKRLKYFF